MDTTFNYADFPTLFNQYFECLNVNCETVCFAIMLFITFVGLYYIPRMFKPSMRCDGNESEGDESDGDERVEDTAHLYYDNYGRCYDVKQLWINT